jgi:ribosomal protein L37AE/L43A
LAEAKIALSDQKEKNAELENELKQLRKSKIDIDTLSRVEELFFDKNDSQFKCPTCVEARQLIVSLSVKPGHPMNLKCNHCNSEFHNPRYTPRRPVQVNTRFNPFDY